MGDDMSRWIKKSSGIIVGNKIVTQKQCRYFGFTLITGSANKQFTAYDGINNSGTVVENVLCDGNKPTDGHSHSIPVLCNYGLYIEVASGAQALVYYYDEIY